MRDCENKVYAIRDCYCICDLFFYFEAKYGVGRSQKGENKYVRRTFSNLQIFLIVLFRHGQKHSEYNFSVFV